MRLKAACLFCLFAAVAMTLLAVAQEGYPLTGVWYGEWGPPAHRNQIVVVMSYDGKKISGLINPGPDSFPIKVATLDSTKWTVHIEGDVKDDGGKPVHFIAVGKLENIGRYQRTLSGTWTDGTTKSDFKLKRG